MTSDAVIFDWRGTLVTTLSEREWVTLGVAAVGMPVDTVECVIAAIETANGPEDRLDAPVVYCDAAVHRATRTR